MRLFFISVLMLAGAGATAQFKNVLIDSTANKSGRYPTEPSVAINPKNPDNLVVGASIDNAYHSMDGGKTWIKARFLSPHGIWGDPVLVADPSGDFYYFHLSDPTGKNWESDEILDRIVVHKSKDGGKSWDGGESIGHNPPKDQDKPWAVADRKGNLYATWTQFDTYGSDSPECQSVILFSKSSNGTKWSKPIVLSQYAGNCADDDGTVMGAIPVVTNDGKIFVVWSHEGVILLDRSFDGGTMWLTNDIGVVEQAGGWNVSIPGLQRANGLPVLAADNTTKTNYSGALYLAWADQRHGENDTDIWFTRSFNFGDNWTQPMRINDDGPGKHQFMPWIAVDPSSGYVYIVYYDRRDHEDDQTDVYLAWSTDNGSSFKNIKISETSFKPQADVFFGDYLNIATQNGNIAIVWTRMDNGRTSIWGSFFKHESLEKGSKAK